MHHSLYKKGASHIFYWWLQKDLRKFLQQVESMSVKNAIQQHPENGASASTVEEWKQRMWDYGTYLMEHTYKEGQPPVLKRSLHEQAESAVEDLTASFFNGLKEKHALAEFFPSPPAWESARERDGDFSSVFKSLQAVTEKYSFEQLLRLMKRESALPAMLNALFRDSFSFIKKRPFKPAQKHYVMLVWDLLYQAARDIKRFSEKHELAFSHDGEIRCFYNMLNLNLHYFAIHGRVLRSMEDREVVFAASALHPLQDDYLDETEPPKEAVEAIGEKVKGKNSLFFNEKTRGMFDLIDVIYKKYPVKDNPMLVAIFSSLHEYQCLSEVQKKDDIREEQLLRLSFMKGGYAFAFFGYIAHGEMSIAQFHHFFIMGAIFQLLDDFHDIEDDLESGSTTVWTRALQNGEELDHILNATLALQHYYEEKTNLIPDFRYPVFIRRIELFGIRYDAFRFFTMNESYFSEEYVQEFENCFPFSLKMPKKIYNSSRPYEQIDTIMTVLEEWKALFMKK